MKKIRHFVSVLAAMVFMAASTSAIASGQWMTPEYANGEYRPLSMVIIPPRAEVMLKKVTSTEQMVEESGVLEDTTAEILKEHFEKKGYEIRILSVEDVNSDPALKDMIRKLNEVYDEEMLLLRTKAKNIRERRYSYGDEARIVADYVGAEALVVARVNALGASGGQKAMAFLIGGTSGHADISAGIVAGDNGDLEAFYQNINGNISPAQLSDKPRETMEKVAKKLFKKLPEVGKSAKWNKRWPQATDRQVPEALSAGEEDLSDLEAMFGDEAEAPAAAVESMAGEIAEAPVDGEAAEEAVDEALEEAEAAQEAADEAVEEVVPVD